MLRTKPTRSASAQRNFLRGPITNPRLRRARGDKLTDVFPPEAYVGERVRSFLAASSWFWYCYTCFQPNPEGQADDSSPVE